MESDLSDLAQQYYQTKQKLEEKRQELSDVRASTFGADSEAVEEKARSMFENIGVGNAEGKSQKIEELEQEVKEAEQEVGKIEEELQRGFADIRFPFDETIETRDEETAFPFIDPLPEEVIQAVDDVIRNNVNSGNVELQTNEIVVYTDDVNEAISAVEDFAKDLREAARHELNTDEYVEKLTTRDVKIQRMLYELYESDKPLAKKELEERSEVEKGGLRGVLYSVYDRDPYLNKENQKYSLSEIGQSVMEKFVQENEKPEIPNDEASEPKEKEEDEDSQTTLNSPGDSE